MSAYVRLLRPLLFSLDPETVHGLALKLLRSGALKLLPDRSGVGSPVKALGIEFPNAIGLAAGFDKDGLALEAWPRMGFGFVEVGTVTRYPQPGNPRPRLFRLPGQNALINRMGFNNQGAEALARRLERERPNYPIGINIGKSKATPLEDAAEDYAYSFKLLANLGDYFVVNVSSPNTPGLRTLQDREPLSRILRRLREIDSSRPLLVKLAPDLENEALEEAVQVVVEMGIEGLVCGNTSLRRQEIGVDDDREGGVSGAPIRDLSDRQLARVRQLAPKLLLIGVGGILSGEDALRKIELGATLVQSYTGFVYGGPDFPARIALALRQAGNGAPEPNV